MVCIDGGQFSMGRDDRTVEEEGPAYARSVEPFYLDAHEVTNRQYSLFLKAVGEPELSYPDGQADFPVVNVDWIDASRYADWAGKRLPTEKEWEFAARGTDGRLYPWGNDWEDGLANIAGARKTFSEVGEFSRGKSPFGIYDLVGNAGEWTADDFKPYPRGTLSKTYKGKTNLKTIRGGSFALGKDFAAATYRFGYPASDAPNGYSLTGFRCAKDLSK
jgi:serine/threonine-protein kinase